MDMYPVNEWEDETEILAAIKEVEVHEWYFRDIRMVKSY